MKRCILKVFLLILICFPLFKIFENIDIKAETTSETLSVEFGVESKTTVELGTNTNYDGWNCDEIAALYISIGNMDISKVYKLIITMDPIVYAPVETLPYPSGASTSFTKNEDLPINGSESYELMPYSGTIVYTFNNDKDKTIEIDNFKLQLKYDQILWHKFANQAINIGDGPLLKVELIEGDSNTLSTKYLNNYLVWHNFVNYANESYTEKKNILESFVFTVSKTVLCKNVPLRNPIPVRLGYVA